MHILKGSEIKTNKITALMFSPPGIGKTYALGDLPGKTLIIDIDQGTSVLKDHPNAKNIDIIRMDENLSDMKDVLAMLEEKCAYNNVCLDSLSELERASLAILGRTGKNGGAPELGHYNQVNFKIVDLCRRLRALPANLVLTAWQTSVEIVAVGGEKYNRAAPMLTGKSADNVCGICDIVGELIVSPKDGKRYIRLAAQADLVAKDRIFKREFCEPKDLLGGNKNDNK